MRSSTPRHNVCTALIHTRSPHLLAVKELLAPAARLVRQSAPRARPRPCRVVSAALAGLEPQRTAARPACLGSRAQGGPGWLLVAGAGAFVDELIFRLVAH